MKKVFDKYEIVSKEFFTTNYQKLRIKDKTFHIKKNGKFVKKDYDFSGNPASAPSTALFVSGVIMFLVSSASMAIFSMVLTFIGISIFVPSYLFRGKLTYSNKRTADEQLKLILEKKNSKYERDNFKDDGIVTVKEVVVRKD